MKPKDIFKKFDDGDLRKNVKEIYKKLYEEDCVVRYLSWNKYRIVIVIGCGGLFCFVDEDKSCVVFSGFRVSEIGDFLGDIDKDIIYEDKQKKKKADEILLVDEI